MFKLILIIVDIICLANIKANLLCIDEGEMRLGLSIDIQKDMNF